MKIISKRFKFNKFKSNQSNLICFLSNVIKKNIKICTIVFFSMLIVTYLNTILPKILQYVLDNVVTQGNIHLLITLSIIYFLINIIITLINIKKEVLISIVQKKTANIFRINMLNKLSRLSGAYYSDLKTGEMLNLIDGDCNIIESYGIDIWFGIISNILMAILALCNLIKIQKKMLIIVLLVQLIMILSQLIFTKKIINRTKEIRKEEGYVFDFIQEYVANIVQIIINKSKLYYFNNYISKLKILTKKEMKLNSIYVSNSEVAQLLSSVITIFIYAYGGFQIIKKNMTIGELIAFEQYIWLFISPCVNLLRSNTNIQKMLVSLERINNFLYESENVQAKKNSIIINNNIKTIKFNNVVFSYDDNIVLNNINFQLTSGNVYAFVGKTGCGKSTIINLLYRLWDSQEGNILIDNIDIKEFNLKSLRKNISIVSQNMHLISASIEDNLTLGNLNITEDRYVNICKLLELDSFIESLAQGYKTVVGENGVKLSGGQKQRIVIGRMLLQSKNILIFDEATSALDNITQNAILSSIHNYYNDKIVIIIAHRLSTVKNANLIYVMEDGKICESGSHEKLMSNRKYYYNLVIEQNNKD